MIAGTCPNGGTATTCLTETGGLGVGNDFAAVLVVLFGIELIAATSQCAAEPPVAEPAYRRGEGRRAG